MTTKLEAAAATAAAKAEAAQRALAAEQARRAADSARRQDQWDRRRFDELSGVDWDTEITAARQHLNDVLAADPIVTAAAALLATIVQRNYASAELTNLAGRVSAPYEPAPLPAPNVDVTAEIRQAVEAVAHRIVTDDVARLADEQQSYVNPDEQAQDVNGRAKGAV